MDVFQIDQPDIEGSGEDKENLNPARVRKADVLETDVLCLRVAIPLNFLKLIACLLSLTILRRRCAASSQTK